MPLDNDNLDRCLVAFQRDEPDLREWCMGHIVVFNLGRTVGIFINATEANRWARKQFGRGNYIAMRVE